MKRLTVTEAKKIPWVTHLSEGVECIGFKAHTPLKAMFSMGSKPPVGLDKYRCKSPAHWQYRALQRSGAQSGSYCWSHLIHRCFMDHDREVRRLEDWQESQA